MGAIPTELHKGAVLLDTLFLGSVGASSLEQNTLGIIIDIDPTSILVYWFDRKNPWGGYDVEYERFAVNNPANIAQLVAMKKAYQDSEKENDNV